MSWRKEKFQKELMRRAGEFFEREAGRETLITVTSATASSDFKNATIYVTVLPETEEEKTLQYLKRKRGDLRNFLKKTHRMKALPFIEINIDQGERNRQRVEDALKEE